jgi:sec-independent protein translocase protein TatA
MKLGATELALILIIALVIFGPAKLPELGRSIGKALNEFKTQANKVTDEFKDDSDEEEKKE